MADKKITVLGDIADESLTPEEEHKIEVKIDKMLDIEQPDDFPAKTESKKTVKPKIEKKNKKILSSSDDEVADLPAPVESHEALTLAPPEPASASEEISKGAPPLPKKSPKKISIPIKEHGAEPASEPDKAVPEAMPAPQELNVTELPAELAPEKLPSQPLKITIDNVEPQTDEVPAEPEPESGPEEPDPAPGVAEEKDSDLLAESIADEPEESPAQSEPKAPAEEVKPPAPQPEESSAKKYRPPDGPLPFKRAEPLPEQSNKPPVQNSGAELSDEDAAILRAFEQSPNKKTRKPSKPRSGKKSAWLIVLLLALLVAAGVLPQTRATALNLLHVRGALTVTVFDGPSRTPLSNAKIVDGASTATTDAAGKATLKNLRLGSQVVVIRKDAFSTRSEQVYVSWRKTSPLSINLYAPGTPYSFTVTDYISGLPVSGAKSSVGAGQTASDKTGKLIVDLSKSEIKVGTITIDAAGYQPAKVQLPADITTTTAVQLVSSASDVYVSKVDGKYNVYNIGLDGNYQKLLLAGTGYETSRMDLVVNSDGSQAAFVSTRDNQSDKTGDLLDTLTLIDIAKATSSTLDHAQQIKVVGWFGNHLVYTALQANAAADDPARYQLVSYDQKTNKKLELDHANSFNDVVAASGAIYYATSNKLSGGSSQFIKVSPDGSSKQTLLTSEVTSILRTDYSDFILATPSASYGYKLGDPKPTPTNTTATKTRLYVDSPDGKYSAWVDETNGELMLYSQATKSERSLTKQVSLAYPIRWLNGTTLVFRVSNNYAPSDNAIGVNGASAKKITTVVDINGLTSWKD